LSRFYVIFLILLITKQVIGQKNKCSQETDTSHCYIRQNTPASKFGIEKKFESDDLIPNTFTPLLADVDGDCIPDFISPDSNNQGILFIDTKSGALKFKISTYTLYPFSPNNICIADINGDDLPELFVITSPYSQNPTNIQGRLICYNLKGDVIWISDQRVDLNYKGDITRVFGIPAIADFNEDGIPEIYISNKIFNALTGIKLGDGGPNGIGTEDYQTYHYSSISIAAQLDEDSTDLELAAGFTVYKVVILNPSGISGNSLLPINIKVNNEFKDGVTTISDINLDGRLDVIVTTPGPSNVGLIYVYTLSNGSPKLIAKAFPPGGNDALIGPPLTGDIKGFGKPSIIFSRSSRLYSYSYNGSGFLQLDWNQNTTDTSGSIGITMFDLNNDGVQEIIYRDMNSLNIINGSVLPITISSINCLAPTLSENPIVGDFDNSGHAKICIPCASEIYNPYGKLTVFGPPDSLPKWAPARGIWNQYNYHVLNINDDLSVPRIQKNNATFKNGKYNNFYVQESLLEDGMYLKKAASLTGKIKCINYDPINNEYTVIFDIYNRTDASFNADSSLPVSFYNGDPSTSGTLISTYYTLKKMESGDSLLNLVFKFSAVNLSDLFMVINTTRNGTGQFDPKDFSILECDYTDNTFHTPELPKIKNLYISICKGDIYNFYDTLLIDTGVYYHKLSAENGCDSLIFKLELSNVDTVHITQSIIACDGYTWNGITYKQSGSFIYDTINQFGCDSITTLDLVINVSTSSTTVGTACDSFIWNGNTYDKSGNYQYQTLNNVGCDSITTLELTINNSDDKLINHSACNSYTWNGQIYTRSGTYKFDTVNRFGCDSAVTLDLTINSIINVTIGDQACDIYNWNGNTYTQSGTYQFNTINQQGCDSITTLQLTINSSNNSITTLTTCDNFTWNGITYDQSGSYQFKTQNAVGCDSTAFLQLTVNKSNNSITTLNICDSITWNGVNYDQSGSYPFQTLNNLGCDSIATLNLTINKSDYLVSNQSACDSFTWNGNTYNKSGNYLYQTVNNLGCDSVIKLNLTINISTKADLALFVCDSLNFLGNILNANGNYTFMIQNSAGCDSVINLSLNIRSELYNISVANCDTFIWNVNQQSYSKSGIYFQKYINSFGCDSIYKLDLTINKNYDELQQAEACKEYLWQVNNVLLKQSGEYIYPLKTIEGCDSILRLNLIINYDFEKTDTVITDSTYTWPVNHKSYPTSGIYQEQFTSGGGCDSIRYLFLIIKKNIGIYYPNVIRPGGPNGWFTIFDNGHTISSIETLTVYDRWGDLVWKKHGILPNDLQMGWDGTFNGVKVLPGVYVWHAQLALKDGSMITEKGDVTVIR
jgi:hypothetical protein